ncbi:uncharacterized protein LOC119766948 [Culex quinquefasciatus]|uniref:uncharacterized protein LOC119766948 n=1 Tax=Culex quinquefasciatus TaxID=7176 RepID=UPI0018E2F278|nr:uncharacterized protein LOC119766948 [Culex quinquefasciatus]
MSKLEPIEPDQITADIRHLQCPIVKETSRRLTALRQDETFYRTHVISTVQHRQFHKLLKTILLIIGSIMVYNVVFGITNSGCCLEEPSWWAVKVGSWLGFKDRIYY